MFQRGLEESPGRGGTALSGADGPPDHGVAGSGASEAGAGPSVPASEPEPLSEPEPGRPGGTSRPTGRGAAWVLGVVALLGVVGGGLLLVWYMEGRGVNLTGDEPAYVVAAQSYAHGHATVLPTITGDLRTHTFAEYPPGTPSSAMEPTPGRHGTISPFEPGLGALLAPFVLLRPLLFGASLGMLVLNGAGLVLLHRRVTRLGSLGPRAQLLFGLLLATPALMVAMPQVYPDLLSGVVLACALVEIALFEQRRPADPVGPVIVVAAAVLLPWLQIKNLVPALVLVAALVAVRWRRSAPVGGTVAAVGCCVLGWVALASYNLWGFGRLLGFPEPSPRFSGRGAEYTLGLLFDSHQGLFVQAPLAVLGVLGLWMARRSGPVAVSATVLGVAAVLVLNGTYVANPYGGLSLAGRFMWTAMPVLLAWSGVVVARWQDAGRSLWVPMAAVAGLWGYQAAAILDGSHVFYSAYRPQPLWDPAAWPGWWQGTERLLPQFDLPGRALGAPAAGLVVVLAVLAALVVAAVSYARTARLGRRALLAVAVLAAGVVVAAVTVVPVAPARPLAFDGAAGRGAAGDRRPSRRHPTGPALPATRRHLPARGRLPPRRRRASGAAAGGLPGARGNRHPGPEAATGRPSRGHRQPRVQRGGHRELAGRAGAPLAPVGLVAVAGGRSELSTAGFT